MEMTFLSSSHFSQFPQDNRRKECHFSHLESNSVNLGKGISISPSVGKVDPKTAAMTELPQFQKGELLLHGNHCSLAHNLLVVASPITSMSVTVTHTDDITGTNLSRQDINLIDILDNNDHGGATTSTHNFNNLVQIKPTYPHDGPLNPASSNFI